MNTQTLNEAQKQAVLDLLVLAMYGHLASVEDARVQRWLSSVGANSEYDRNRLFDAAVSRVRTHIGSPEKAAAHAAALAATFTTHDQRRGVHSALVDLMTSDTRVAAAENAFLSVIEEKFRV